MASTAFRFAALGPDPLIFYGDAVSFMGADTVLMSRWCERGLLCVVDVDGRPAVSAMAVAQLYAVRSGEVSPAEVLDDLFLRHSIADRLDELAAVRTVGP